MGRESLANCNAHAMLADSAVLEPLHDHQREKLLHMLAFVTGEVEPETLEPKVAKKKKKKPKADEPVAGVAPKKKKKKKK